MMVELKWMATFLILDLQPTTNPFSHGEVSEYGRGDDEQTKEKITFDDVHLVL